MAECGVAEWWNWRVVRKEYQDFFSVTRRRKETDACEPQPQSL